MTRIQAVNLTKDGRSIEAEAWQQWLDEAAGLAQRFRDEMEADDPFAYNETASVSFLIAAATKAGMLCMSEYAGAKRGASDRRTKNHGRYDFWMSSGRGRNWAIEFKQLFRPLTPRRLESRMAEAKACAKRIDAAECHRAVAGLIVSLDLYDGSDHAKARRACDGFANQAQYSWRIGDRAAGLPETYLFFETVKKHD